MKTLTCIKSALLVVLVLVAAIPQQARAALAWNGSRYNDGYSVTHLVDTNRSLFLVLNRGTQAYTEVDLATTGWLIYDFRVLDDGALVLHWIQGGGSNFNVAVWKIANGALVGAAGYAVSGWTPLFPVNGFGGPVGDKNLICFANQNAPQVAAWLLGMSGNVERVLAWANTAGWEVDGIMTSEDASLFAVIWLGQSSTGSNSSALACYTFDGNGNWIGANSFPPVDANTPFTDSTQYNDGFSVTNLVFGARSYFRVLNRGNPAYAAIDLGTTGWNLYDYQLLGDGTLVLHWSQPTGTGFLLAIWRITNGALVSAAGYAVSGWIPLDPSLALLNPLNPIAYYGGPVGNKDLICFQNAGAPQVAAWLLGPSGNVERTFAWAGGSFLWGGAADWFIPGIYASEDASLFMVEWLGNGLAYYTFDGNGNWIGANSY